jgi:Sec-independent protein translocase protein TatA
MKKGKRRSIWVWLVLVAVVLMLFGPTVFAGASSSTAAAKGQYTWLPECLE